MTMKARDFERDVWPAEVAGAELIDVASVVVLVVFLTLLAFAVMKSLRDR